MPNHALSNYVADLLSFTSAPTVRRELAVTASTIALLGVLWVIGSDPSFLLVFAVVLGLYSVLRLGLAAWKQTRQSGKARTR
ncbi:hypothetical protein [Cryptosporangium minutisporangium]|uniref:Uncharacterized protein n=1 Tax=Cryptosporangium minutisporangium TaxID=113569 RepID=A0ABP6SQP3_9ACTN